MKFLLICATLFIAALLLFADDQKITITTTNGKKFENVTLSRVEPDGLVLITDAGIEKVPFAVLPPELRARYGYDPAKATAFQSVTLKAARGRASQEEAQRQQKINAELLANKIATESKKLTGEVVAIVNQRVVVDCPSPAPYHASGLQSIGGGDGSHSFHSGLECAYGEIILKGYPTNNLAEGDKIKVIAVEVGVENLGEHRLRVYQFVKDQQ